MGLLRGFKAKFTGNSTSKEKPPEVVCLRYHVVAEFDPQEPSISIPKDFKKTDVIRQQSKTRKTVAKSAIFHEENDVSTPPSRNIPKKYWSLDDISAETSTEGNGKLQYNKHQSIEIPNGSAAELSENGTADYNKVLNMQKPKETRIKTILKPTPNYEELKKLHEQKKLNLSDTTIDGNIQENGIVHEKQLIKDTEFRNENISANMAAVNENLDIVTKKHLSANTSNSDTNAQTLRSFSNDQDTQYISFNDDQSTLIFMTQHSNDTNVENVEDNNKENFKVAPETSDNQGNFTINFVPNNTMYGEEDFRVNVVKQDFDRKYSCSEDEISQDEISDTEEEKPSFTKMGYSSHAASIFFGEGTEPVTNRPRRLKFDDDDWDESRRSSAEC